MQCFRFSFSNSAFRFKLKILSWRPCGLDTGGGLICRVPELFGNWESSESTSSENSDSVTSSVFTTSSYSSSFKIFNEK